MLEQEYYKQKKILEEAQRRIEVVSQPQLTDTEHIFTLHEALARKRKVLSSSDIEEFVVCVLLLYSPLTLWENKQCYRGVNNALANALDLSRPSISRYVNNVRVRYRYNHCGLRERSHFVLGVLADEIRAIIKERI